MNFEYYYGSQADQFSFIRMPRLLLLDNAFADISLQAKVLYSVLLDRMSLSRKNQWFDEENKVYIIYPVAEIQEDLGFSKKKALDYMAELENFGLIEKKKRGLGMPNIIYVKSFIVSQKNSGGIEKGTSALIPCSSRSPQIDTSEVLSGNFRSPQIDTTEVLSGNFRGTQNDTPEVPKSLPLYNKTYINNTNQSNTESNHILSQPKDKIRYDFCQNDTEAYAEIIKKNIELNTLLIDHPGDKEIIQEIYDLILETMIADTKKVLIAGKFYPQQYVKSKFMKLNYWHVQYILQCLKKSSAKVKNIKKYLLAALFNAPSTMENFYQVEINHDMPQYVE